MDFTTRVSASLRATIPVLAINSVEEERLTSDLWKIVQFIKDSNEKGIEIPKFNAYYRWDRGSGLTDMIQMKNGSNIKLADPMALFNDITVFNDNKPNPVYQRCVIVMFDFGAITLENQPTLVRQLKNSINKFTAYKSTFIFVGPRFNWPPEVERLIVHVDYELPNESQIEAQFDKDITFITKKYPDKFPNGLFDDEMARFQSIKAARGLTLTEVKRAIGFSVVSSGKIDPRLVTEEKINAIKRTGLLEYIPTENYNLSNIGGLGNLKQYIAKRKNSFTNEAKSFGVKCPKGVLLLGIPGTGKSLAAKTVGTVLGIPTVKFEISSLLGGIVGESEHKCQQAIKQLSAISPCVCWWDEIEKSLAGCASGRSDGGVMSRLFGQVLTFMSEQNDGVFFVATANNIQELAANNPELLRHGRWDAICFCNLPNTEERKEIWEVHLRAVKRDPSKFDVGNLAYNTEGYTGAEIESIVSEAIVEAYNKYIDDKISDITTDLLLKCKPKIKPLSYTMKDVIDYMKKEAELRGYLVANSCENLGDEFVKLVETDTNN